MPLLDRLDAVAEQLSDEDRAAVRRYLEGVTEVYRAWAAGEPGNGE
jgi:hypothetical protein